MSNKYIVKSCLSGDTLILRARPTGPGQPPKERTIHIAEVAAPRLGTSQRDDEPFAFESREFLRGLTVGKEITFESSYSIPTNDGSLRDVGIATVNGQDITIELLKNGWAKCKENRREATDEDIQRRAVETEAKTAGRGVWDPNGPPQRNVYHTMPADSQRFMTQWKGKPIPGIVEAVRDGSNLRVRLNLSPAEHQFVNLSLAGIKCPRAAAKEGEKSEPLGDEARAFVEARLLQRHVTVHLLSLPAPPATPFSSTSSEAAPAATTFIGSVIHPVGGNIAEHLVGAGLAKVVDWHAGMLAASGAMERIRAAEKSAKEKRLGVYGAAAATATQPAKNGTSTPSLRTEFTGQVIRVWSGDQISVYDEDAHKERRFQLSSVRGPKSSDPKQAHYATEAREFLRKKLIGKTVTVHVDFIRPKDGEYDERECASIIVPGQKTSVAEQLIEKGFATAVRHRRDDENRSPDYDKLIAAEQAAASANRGLHSGKEVAAPRIVNASETHAKAQQFLPSLKRSGRIPAVVDYVAAGSRFKVILPKENQSMILVLSGIRAPRASRGSGEKPEPYGQESLEFATRRYLQRDVEVQFDNIDKSGGFIGSVYVTQEDKSVENAAVKLVQEGLATVHDYSAEGLSWHKQLYDAQEAAKAEHKNIWKDFTDEPQVEATSAEEALKPQYLDVIISDVRERPNFGFSVQILNNEGIGALERLMREFSLHHKSAKSGTLTSDPKSGDLISARFSGDDGWYRAKVRRVNSAKKECEVIFIDYGNQETVPFSRIRPLDERFRSLPGQAQEARLSFVKLPDTSSDYYEDAVHRFRQLCEGRKIIANIDAREGSMLHLRLIDPADASTPTDSINSQLVREGLVFVDRKGCKYIASYPTILKRLQEDTEIAKNTRAGMYEFGDVSPDDE